MCVFLIDVGLWEFKVYMDGSRDGQKLMAFLEDIKLIYGYSVDFFTNPYQSESKQTKVTIY